MGIVESFLRSYANSRSNWSEAINYWSRMTHQQRLTALSRIGRRKVSMHFFVVLHASGYDIAPYQHYAEVVSPGFEILDLVRNDRPLFFQS